MATAAQIEANRANARASTGPRTEEGKARSSGNAKTHGLFASLESLAPTEQERYHRVLEFHTGSWRPAGEEDARLVADLALADFRRDRARALEGAWFADRVEQLRKDDGLPETLTPAQVIRLEARALQQDCDFSGVLSRLFKWERAYHRDFDRLTAQLRESSLNRSFKNAKTNPIPHQPSVPSTTSPVGQASRPVPDTSPAPTSRTNEANPAPMAVPAPPRNAPPGDTEAHNPQGSSPIADPRVPPQTPVPSTASPVGQASRPVPDASPATPRSAPCPCGSGVKYKRCCGRNAPPQLFPGTKAA